MASAAVNTQRLLETFHGIQGGRYDPSVQSTQGSAGTIFIQLPPFGLSTPFALWQKQDNGNTTNWAEISASSTGITDYKAPVNLASTADVPLSGGAALLIDGVAVANGNRILLKDQATASQNGIYIASGIGTAYLLTRAPDANTSAEVTQGMFTWVMFGSTNLETGWILTTPNPITLGTTALTFVEIPIPGLSSIGVIDSQPKSANAAVIAAGVLYMQTADGGFPGVLSLAAQNIVGDKSFSQPISLFDQAVPPVVAAGGTVAAYSDAADNLLKYVDGSGDVRVVNGIVREEGVDTVVAPQFLNFIGVGVTVTPNGLGADVTIPAGAGTSEEIEFRTIDAAEALAGQLTLIGLPLNVNKVILSVGGVTQFDTEDYSVSGNVLSWDDPGQIGLTIGVAAGDKFVISYEV